MGKKLGGKTNLYAFEAGPRKNGFSDPTQHWHFPSSDLDLPNICVPKKKRTKRNIRAGEQRC